MDLTVFFTVTKFNYYLTILGDQKILLIHIFIFIEYE